MALAFNGDAIGARLHGGPDTVEWAVGHAGMRRFHARRAVEPVRFELRGLEGRLVLASNPVYAITDASIQAAERLMCHKDC